MRYFEIVKQSAKHILSGTDLREASAGASRIDGTKSVGSWQTGTAILPKLSDPINRQSRRRHLSPRRSQ